MKYLQVIEKAYQDYLQEIPLDLRRQQEKDRINVWRDVIQYSKQEYTRLVHALSVSRSLDNFVTNSGGDFDNLAPVIDSAVKNKLVSIANDGTITSELGNSTIANMERKDSIFVANAEYNQFPCDSESSDYRADYILNRYPYVEELRVGLVGDDDFISIRLAGSRSIETVVVEKDKRIVDALKPYATDGRINIYNHDVRDTARNVNLDTFVTDPPYTFDGALAFITCGLAMMGSQKGKEFYVILNPSMMGKRWNRLVTVLAEHGVVIKGVGKNVSNYRLPANFSERKRADEFLESIGVNPSSLEYSSNSTMYTFLATQDIDIEKLTSVINYGDMYEHYS